MKHYYLLLQMRGKIQPEISRQGKMNHTREMEIFERRWEDMNMDCLVNIFGRVGIESLSLDLPFVCKSWYKATLNPLCWRSLLFPKNLDSSRFGSNEITFKWLPGLQEIIKAVVKRSQRGAIELALPEECSEEGLNYVSEECPALKFLALRSRVVIPSVISKWKNLEALYLLQFSENLEEIVVEISLHCSNFVRLCVMRATIYDADALAIATLLPNITRLVLRHSILERSNLVTILKGCKKLVHFDASYCKGFESNDEEILKLASHITTFMCDGSFVDYDDDDRFGLCSRDVDCYYGSD